MSARRTLPVASDVDSALGPAPASYAQPEAVVLTLRRHGRHLLLPVVVLIVVAALAGFWVGGLPESWMNLAAAAGAVAVAFALGIVPIFAWLARRTTVTTRRVITHRGFLVRRRTQISLARVREVRSRRGPIQRLWGSGDIELLHGAESLLLADVPGVGVAVEALQELIERNYEHSTRALQRAAALGEAGSPAPAEGEGDLSFW